MSLENVLHLAKSSCSKEQAWSNLLNNQQYIFQVAQLNHTVYKEINI